MDAQRRSQVYSQVDGGAVKAESTGRLRGGNILRSLAVFRSEGNVQDSLRVL